MTSKHLCRADACCCASLRNASSRPPTASRSPGSPTSCRPRRAARPPAPRKTRWPAPRAGAAAAPCARSAATSPPATSARRRSWAHCESTNVDRPRFSSARAFGANRKSDRALAEALDRNRRAPVFQAPGHPRRQPQDVAAGRPLHERQLLAPERVVIEVRARRCSHAPAPQRGPPPASPRPAVTSAHNTIYALPYTTRWAPTSASTTVAAASSDRPATSANAVAAARTSPARERRRTETMPPLMR